MEATTGEADDRAAPAGLSCRAIKLPLTVAR